MKTAALLKTTLVRGDHVRSFDVRRAPLAGWEASESEDRRVVRQQQYMDWHRVERTITDIHWKIARLVEQGCRDITVCD
jgi:hypothetical protein